MSKTALDTLLEAAILAPSGDNTQPFRFTVDRKQWTISVDVDPARDPSPMNAGQRMAQIALGAAIENMVRTAERNAWCLQLQEATNEGLLQLHLEPTPDIGTIDPLIHARVTNRKVYRGGEISNECLALLESAANGFDGAQGYWITDRPRLEKLCKLIARADALILGTKPIRDAFLAKVRFDQPVNATVDEGLSLGSLEVSAFERLMLRVMKYMPDEVLRLMGARRVFSQAANKLASSAAGMFLVTASDHSASCLRCVGRLWQRAWLAMTEQGLAEQPMMSLLVLQNVRDSATSAGVLSIKDKDAAEAILSEFETFVASFSVGRPSVLMRFGNSPPPACRVGRLPPRKLTIEI